MYSWGLHAGLRVWKATMRFQPRSMEGAGLRQVETMVAEGDLLRPVEQRDLAAG
jgi:hypothetical protein